MALKEDQRITEKMGIGTSKPVVLHAVDLTEHLRSKGVQQRLARVRGLAQARAQQKS